jgi:hypothetical protein
MTMMMVMTMRANRGGGRKAQVIDVRYRQAQTPLSACLGWLFRYFWEMDEREREGPRGMGRRGGKKGKRKDGMEGGQFPCSHTEPQDGDFEVR